ncbi:MAG TPA: sulfatase-like hydrolase/transferase [Dokdonella sp.]|nr:sulfatase-like hydrolase/transferase [Dokdonella sp.]
MAFDRAALRTAARATGFAAFAWVVFRLCGSEADLAARLYCVSLMLACAVFASVATGRVGVGFFAAAALGGSVWLVSTLKLAYLHEPLFAPDVGYLGRTLFSEVIEHYPAMLHKCIAALVLVPLAAVVLWRFESPGHWRGRRRRVRSLSAFVALGGLVALSWPQGPFAQVYAVPAWEFLEQGKRNPVTTFLRSIGRMRLTMPPNDGDASAYDWGDEGVTGTPTAARPDIVAVLEESTLDPRSWADCTSPRCRFDLFGADARTRAHGLLRVHTYGGGTWTSEFAFLSGLPHTLFGPAGLYAPYNLAPRLHQSLPRRLKALGYRTIAVYPMPSGFVRAADAYADYGFDEFHDARELGIEWETTDLELIDKVEAIHRRARAEDDRPLFIMVLTMRQHGPHDKPLDALPPPWNEPPAPRLDARANRNIGTYLYRLHQSEQALAKLRDDLFSAGRPAVLAHFGDHHPSFDGVESTLASALPPALADRAGTLTYYRIDSNFDGTPLLQPGQPLDIAFLGGLVLDVARLPRGAYFEANARLRERCEGRFQDCADKALLSSFYAYAFGRLGALDE